MYHICIMYPCPYSKDHIHGANQGPASIRESALACANDPQDIEAVLWLSIMLFTKPPIHKAYVKLDLPAPLALLHSPRLCTGQQHQHTCTSNANA